MAASSPLEIAALAFDLGNVLVRVDHLRFCRGLAAFTRPPLSPEEVYAAIFEAGLEFSYDTGRLSSREFYRRVLSQFQLALPYPEFCDLWNDIFDPMDGMEEVVSGLKGRYPLFLMSNTNPLHFHYIRQRFPIVRHFRRFVLSYRVGSRKPEAGIFQALIRESGQPPQRCLFIDDQQPFVAAARQQGLTAWHFTTLEDFQQTLVENGIV
jgi:HAD superfamily hydrolase (TIGR01509 family)